MIDERVLEVEHLVLSSLLVDISLGVVGGLILLVDNSILSRTGTGAQGGIRVLGNALVGLLGCLGTTTLDGLRDVVGGVLDGLHID